MTPQLWWRCRCVDTCGPRHAGCGEEPECAGLLGRGGGGELGRQICRGGVMGTGSGKPLQWMLRLSRHTGREHHSRRGERRKCLMFNQDCGPCSCCCPLPCQCPLCCRDPTHCGEAAGGRRCFTSPQPGERQQEVEAGGGPEPGAATYFLPLAPPPQLPAFPRPAQPHTTWAGADTAPRSPLYLVIFPPSLGGLLLPPPRM